MQIKRVHHHRWNWSWNRNWSAKPIDSIEVPAIPDTQVMMVPQLLDIPQTHTLSTQYQQLEAETLAQKCSEWNTKPEFFID